MNSSSVANLPAAGSIRLSTERERLDCVRALKLVEAPALEGCTSLIECVAAFFRVPVAFFSVIDETRQHFNASVGLEFAGSSRDDSFCKRTIAQTEVYTVSDARRDPAYEGNPLVWSEPFIQFYAGAPVLIDRRHAIGSLCIADHRPREIDASQKRMLKHFSHMLAGLIEIQNLDREKNRLLSPQTSSALNG